MNNQVSQVSGISQNQIGISIKNLFKIFGNNSNNCIDLLHEGISKDDLKNDHDHILGLKDINLEIAPGKIQVIMGLSGSGKSTLIRHINRLIEPTAGEILVDGKNVIDFNTKELQHFRQEYTSMVFQKFALLPHYTILENVSFGLTLKHTDHKLQEKIAQEWVERVGLKGYENCYPNQMSGGMQQRVGLARALANNTPILLMDEPFSALDPLIRNDMQSILLDLQQELSKTIVFITHDLEEALRMGDNIVILRDGEIVQRGSGQRIILDPANEFIESFIKDVNRGRVIRCNILMGKKIDREDIPVIPYETKIEEALRQINHADKDVANLSNKRGNIVGSISINDILNAMLPPKIVGESVIAEITDHPNTILTNKQVETATIN